MLEVIVIAVTAGIANASNVVHHPVPKKPKYVAEGWYAELRKALPLPPKPGSAEQTQDEKSLVELQGSRQARDCEAAKREVLVSLKSFFGEPDGALDDARVEKLAPFFEQVRNDADYFIQRLKKDFPRKRPYLYLTALNPCVPREVTGAYPSGHAVLSRLFALILADLEPGLRARLEGRAAEIARHRVVSGMHHPTDIEAGQALAGLIYEQLRKSRRYQADFAKVK